MKPKYHYILSGIFATWAFVFAMLGNNACWIDGIAAGVCYWTASRMEEKTEERRD